MLLTGLLEADLRQRGTTGAWPTTLPVAYGTERSFAGQAGTALQLSQTGHSSVVQHFYTSDDRCAGLCC